MADETRWGRVGEATTKQKALLVRANDCCGGRINWYRHPAWTEAMRAALGTRRASGGKWFSLIHRMYDPRLLGAARERLNQSKSGAARQRGAGRWSYPRERVPSLSSVLGTVVPGDTIMNSRSLSLRHLALRSASVARCRAHSRPMGRAWPFRTDRPSRRRAEIFLPLRSRPGSWRLQCSGHPPLALEGRLARAR